MMDKMSEKEWGLLVRALRFYADKYNYQFGPEGELSDIELDKGEKARRALAKLGFSL